MSAVVETDVVTVSSEAELRELVGEPKERSVTKERRFAARPRPRLARRVTVLSDRDRRCRQQLRRIAEGRPARLPLVLDDTTLAIPDRPGTPVDDGFVNILDNPHIGLIYPREARTGSPVLR